MKRRIRIIISLVGLAALLLAGCAQAAPTPVPQPTAAPAKATEAPQSTTVPATEVPPTAEPFRVAVIATDVFQDGSWNQWMYESMEALKKKDASVEVSYAEKVAVPDFERVAAEYADKGYDLIIGHTYDYQESAVKVATRYPNTHFAITGGWQFAPNVCGLGIWAHEGGYLAGMLGALMTQTGKVGLIGGFDYAPSQYSFHEAFKLGAKSVNPDIDIVETWVGTWYDMAMGYEAANAQIDAGVDFMAISLSGPGLGAINAAKEHPGVYVVGAFVDMNDLAPDTVITSCVWSATDPVLAVIDDIKNGTFKGEDYPFGMPQGACSLAPFHGLDSKIPADVKAKIDQAGADIISGKLVVPLIKSPQQ